MSNQYKGIICLYFGKLEAILAKLSLALTTAQRNMVPENGLKITTGKKRRGEQNHMKKDAIVNNINSTWEGEGEGSFRDKEDTVISAAVNVSVYFNDQCLQFCLPLLSTTA